MFYDFIYLAKGFRMKPKVRSTLNDVTTGFVFYFLFKVVTKYEPSFGKNDKYPFHWLLFELWPVKNGIITLSSMGK